MKFIDNIIDQNAIKPGDILIFDGEGAQPGSGRLSQSYPIYYGQKIFFNSAYSANYMHAAICTKNDDGLVVIIHLADVSSCSGTVKEDAPRNINTHPFGRAMIVIRPPVEVSNVVVDEANEAVKIVRQNKLKINSSKISYVKAVIGKKSQTSPTTLLPENTCVGFIINLLHLAYKALHKAPYLLAVESATVELLNHTQEIKNKCPSINGENNNPLNWSMLLIPQYKKKLQDGKKNFEPTRIMELIKTLAKAYSTSLKNKWYSQIKIANLDLIINSFTEDKEKTELENAKEFLNQLKSAMEKARLLSSSSSFSHLLKKLEQKGFYKNYVTEPSIVKSAASSLHYHALNA
jgi:hypothetical protein